MAAPLVGLALRAAPMLARGGRLARAGAGMGNTATALAVGAQLAEASNTADTLKTGATALAVGIAVGVAVGVALGHKSPSPNNEAPDVDTAGLGLRPGR